jgi:uncharacterized membrane protein YfbV (UPF0208 family)
MDKNSYKTRPRYLYYISFIAIFALILYFVLTGLSQASAASSTEGQRIAVNSITRAVINCYASEGMYPPSYEYLKEHYGLSVDENKYIIHYTIFAENIMPDITVLTIER